MKKAIIVFMLVSLMISEANAGIADMIANFSPDVVGNMQQINDYDRQKLIYEREKQDFQREEQEYRRRMAEQYIEDMEIDESESENSNGNFLYIIECSPLAGYSFEVNKKFENSIINQKFSIIFSSEKSFLKIGQHTFPLIPLASTREMTTFIKADHNSTSLYSFNVPSKELILSKNVLKNGKLRRQSMNTKCRLL